MTFDDIFYFSYSQKFGPL